jgi:glycine/D-amino acid oxidase-like deaminating enzyme
MEPVEVAIIGGGIVGCACARELARAGHSVTLFEAGSEVAADTSCRAMGHIGIYDESEAQLALSALARSTWDEISTDLPPPVEYIRRGSLWLARESRELEEAARKQGRLRQRGIEAQLLDSEAVYRAEPNVRAGLAGALLVPGDAVIDTTAATRYLAESARRAGAVVRTRTAVARLEPEALELASGERVRATTIVLAAGWQSPKLLPALPIRPRKGHIIRTAARPGFIRHNLSEIGYMAETRPTAGDSISLVVQPRASGQYLLGATRQYAGSSLEVDPRVIEALRRTVEEFVPGFADLPTESTWTGLRPAGPDSVPIIGRWPTSPRWIVAAGHEGIGITTSLATGRLVAEIVDHRTPSIPLAPYSAERLSLGRAAPSD